MSILLNESKSYRWKANRTSMTSPASGRFHVSIIWIVSIFFEGPQLLMPKKVLKRWVSEYDSLQLTVETWNYNELFMQQYCKEIEQIGSHNSFEVSLTTYHFWL